MSVRNTADSGNPLSRILDQLDEPRGSGNQWYARCPAHEDNRASLSITGRGGKVLLRCHRGCAVEDIVAALGLKMADLFERMPGRGDPLFIVAEYDYTDADDGLLYQAVRLAPKDFRQRRPDGRGGWVWNLQGVKRVLYRLSAVLAAGPDDNVFVVEGEKDADRLASLGMIATTNAMGAGKWRREYAEDLRGRNVVVLPDNDDTGRAHARDVARSLVGVAASVKVVELPGLPPKGDVSDWLDAGGIVEDLLGLVDDAEEAQPEEGHGPTWKGKKEERAGDLDPVATLNGHLWTADRLLDENFPEPVWCLDGILPDEGIVFLGGKKKLGKSWLCLQIARAVAAGQATLARETVQGPVVYLALEDGARRIRARIGPSRQCWPHGLPIDLVTNLPHKLDRGGMALLEQVAARGLTYGKPSLVILDTLAKAKSSQMSENEAGPMADLLNHVSDLARKHSALFLVVHHHAKEKRGDPGDDLRGSSALAAASDVNLGLYRDEGNLFALKGEGRDSEPLSLELVFATSGREPYAWQTVGPSNKNEKRRCEADERVLRTLRVHGELSAKDVATHLSIKAQYVVKERLDRLADEGVVIVRSEQQGKTLVCLYRAGGPSTSDNSEEF